MANALFWSIALVFAVVSVGQAQTLADRVTKQQTSIGFKVIEEVGGPTLEEMLEATDMLVRGRMRQAMSYLTEDGRNIYTVYELLDPRTLFSKDGQPTPASISFMQPGGRVSIGVFTASVSYSSVAKIREGTDLILLLHNSGRQYWAVATGGVFAVEKDVVLPLSPFEGPHKKYAGTRSDEFVAHFVNELSRK